jgi:hypothetical protein
MVLNNRLFVAYKYKIIAEAGSEMLISLSGREIFS